MVNDIERSGIGFYVSHGQEGKESDWFPLQHGLQPPLQHYLRDGLARCACRDRATRDDLVTRTWIEFGSNELGPLLEFLNGLGSVWLGVRDMAGHQLLLYRCRCLAQPAAGPADAPLECGTPLVLSEVDRLGLCHFLSHGQEGKESDWLCLHTHTECQLWPYLACLLARNDCQDSHTVNDLLQRVWVVFCAKKPERLLVVVPRWGSVLNYTRRIAQDQVSLYAKRHLLRRQRESAVAHKANEAAPVVLSQARLARILKEIDKFLSRSHRQWLRDHLENPNGPDKIPLTATERQRLHTVLEDVRAYVEKKGLL